MTMALKPSQITRRNFVQRAGLLVSALGVGASVQSGLMDAIVKKATKKWGAEAIAAEPNMVAFHVEILLRAGFQSNSLFPSLGQKMDTRNQALNVYSSPANILPLTLGTQKAGVATPFTANYGATAGSTTPSGAGANGLGAYIMANGGTKYGIATSESISLQNGQHTGTFASRQPSSSSAAPAVLHTALNPMATPIGGLEWNNGVSTTSQNGMYSALSQVKDQTTMQALFKDLPMYFTRNELNLINGAFDATTGALTTPGSIDKFDAMFATKNVPGTTDVAAVSVAGRNQAQLSLLVKHLASLNLITANGAGGNFVGLNTAMGGTQLGVALANAAAAFSAGIISSFTVSLDSADWHGNISNLDDPNGKQGMWNNYIGNALTGFLKSMDQLKSVTYQGGTMPMSNSFLLSMSSEFTRTPNRNGGGMGSDNGDGGNASFVFIGSKVASGNYGNIHGDGSVQGFDPVTGAPSAAQVTEAMVYKTHGALLGISSATLDSIAPGVTTATALVR